MYIENLPKTVALINLTWLIEKKQKQKQKQKIRSENSRWQRLR